MSESSPYLDPYREAVRDAGARFEALLWRSRDAQERRFAVKAELVDLSGRRVADLGCGRADLAAYLRVNGVAPALYLGVDGVPEMITACRERAAGGELGSTEFRERDFVQDEGLFAELVQEGIDVLVFGGSLNTLDQPDAERVLDRAWSAVRAVRDGVLAFNFLSDRHGPGRGGVTKPAVRFDTVRLVGWALDRTSVMAFRQDYLGGHDATIVMRTDGA